MMDETFSSLPFPASSSSRLNLMEQSSSSITQALPVGGLERSVSGLSERTQYSSFRRPSTSHSTLSGNRPNSRHSAKSPLEPPVVEQVISDDEEESVLSFYEISSVEIIVKNIPYFDRKLVPMMESVNLSFSRLPDVPLDIHLFSQLRVLCLSHNSIRSLDSMRLVESCPLLQKIDVSRNRITNIRNFRDLGHLQHLEEIDFRFNPIPIQDNRVAIIQALLFFHPFKPHFPNPEDNSTKKKNPFPEPKVSHHIPPSFFKKPQKRKTLKVKTKFMESSATSAGGTRDFPELKKIPSVSQSLNLRKHPSVDSINLSAIEKESNELRNSLSAPEGKKPRFMNNTISSLRHMAVPPDEQTVSTPTTLQKVASHRNLADDGDPASPMSKLRRSKTVMSTGLKKSEETKKKLITPYLAFAEQQEKMNQFMHHFEMSDMGPFLQSVSQLYQILNDPKSVIEKTKMCPVPRSYNTPFPMLKIINGKIMTIAEYMLAENEEIYDICAHHNRRLGKKLVLDPPIENGRKKILKFKMEFGNELLEKEFHNLNIEEYSSSSDDEDMNKQEADQPQFMDDDEDYIVRKNRVRRINKSKRECDVDYMLSIITKSHRDAIDLEEIGRTFGVKIGPDGRQLSINHEKWGHIERMLGGPIDIGFSETIRKGFSKNKRVTDEILGIKKEGTKQIDFRPFKEQLLDLSHDEVLKRMKRAELIQNIERWSDTVEYLKSIELNTVQNAEDEHALFTRLSERLTHRLETQKITLKPNAYLANDEVSKFYHVQQLAYQKNIKQKEKKEQTRQKKELKLLSNKDIRRHLATSGVGLGGHDPFDERDVDFEPLKFRKIFV